MSLTITNRVYYAAQTEYCSNHMRALMDVARYVRSWRDRRVADETLVARLRCALSRMPQSEATAYYEAASGRGAIRLLRRENLTTQLKCVGCGGDHTSCRCCFFAPAEGD